MPVISEAYQRWAELEARDSSPLYEEWASAIAHDRVVFGLVRSLPEVKRQPNLVFASARAAGAPLVPYAHFRPWLMTHWAAVEAIALTRSTQTNEAARCAVLLPLLSQIEGPVALLEVGASAGLCLYPDRYSYRYETPTGVVRLNPIDGPSSVELCCTITDANTPERLPEIVWRAGIDLNPIDVRNGDDLTWLETLVWPEHQARRERIRAAANIVSADPPHLVQGDLLELLPGLVSKAPKNTSIVVFHSAVLVYLSPERRQQFVDLVTSLDVTWISNEGVPVLPAVAQQLRDPSTGRTVLARDGVAVARTGPHGHSYQGL